MEYYFEPIVRFGSLSPVYLFRLAQLSRACATQARIVWRQIATHDDVEMLRAICFNPQSAQRSFRCSTDRQSCLADAVLHACELVDSSWLIPHVLGWRRDNSQSLTQRVARKRSQSCEKLSPISYIIDATRTISNNTFHWYHANEYMIEPKSHFTADEWNARVIHAIIAFTREDAAQPTLTLLAALDHAERFVRLAARCAVFEFRPKLLRSLIAHYGANGVNIDGLAHDLYNDAELDFSSFIATNSSVPSLRLDLSQVRHFESIETFAVLARYQSTHFVDKFRLGTQSVARRTMTSLYIVYDNTSRLLPQLDWNDRRVTTALWNFAYNELHKVLAYYPINETARRVIATWPDDFDGQKCFMSMWQATWDHKMKKSREAHLTTTALSKTHMYNVVTLTNIFGDSRMLQMFADCIENAPSLRREEYVKWLHQFIDHVT